MLKIRLFRIGKKNQPNFKIVVTDKKNPPKRGRFVEEVGFWNPLTKEKFLRKERINYWISVGAKPSDTVHNMLVSEGIIKEEEKIGKHKKPKEKPSDASTEALAETEKKTVAALPEADNSQRKGEGEKEKKAEISSSDAPAPAEIKPSEKAPEGKTEEKKEDVSSESPGKEEPKEVSPKETKEPEKEVKKEEVKEEEEKPSADKAKESELPDAKNMKDKEEKPASEEKKAELSPKEPPVASSQED